MKQMFTDVDQILKNKELIKWDHLRLMSVIQTLLQHQIFVLHCWG